MQLINVEGTSMVGMSGAAATVFRSASASSWASGCSGKGEGGGWRAHQPDWQQGGRVLTGGPLHHRPPLLPQLTFLCQLSPLSRCSVMRDNGINVIMISQASSEHSVCFAVKTADTDKALDALKAR